MERGYFAHETAVIDDGCSIGEGTRIWHFSHIMTGAVLGRDCNIGQNVVISPGVVLGNNVKVQNNMSLSIRELRVRMMCSSGLPVCLPMWSIPAVQCAAGVNMPLPEWGGELR